jgi:hypothetical protein
MIERGIAIANELSAPSLPKAAILVPLPYNIVYNRPCERCTLGRACTLDRAWIVAQGRHRPEPAKTAFEFHSKS